MRSPSLNAPKPSGARTPFGKSMLKHFLLSPEYRNLNHGSFGTFPHAVRDKQREYLDLCESAPDPYIRYTFPPLLDENRLAISKLLNVPVETVVFVPNVTTALNTVLRNIVWNDDKKDEILYFSTIYGSCGNTVDYLEEYTLSKVTGRKIDVIYPIEDNDYIQLLKDAISKSRKEGKRPRLAIFDTITSVPGVRVPFEALTTLCHEEGVLSLIDGAHGVGNIKLDIEKLNPDFFMSNCHKWLFVPRGCAVLYVPVKHQAMIRSSLPTSHGFVHSPKSFNSPTEPNKFLVKQSGTIRKSDFVEMFEFVGTIDDSPYISVTSALQFREEVCGGEDAIMSYTQNLAKTGGALVASILDTYVLDNSTNTITNCSLVNIRVPLTMRKEELVDHPSWWLVKEEDVNNIAVWVTEALAFEYGSYLPVFAFQGEWWTRISAQVYLDVDDFEWAGKALKELCEKVGKGGFTKK